MSGVSRCIFSQDDMQFSAGGEPFKKRYVWNSLTDWKTWVASAFNILIFDHRIPILSYVVGIYMGLCIRHYVAVPLTNSKCSDGPLFAFALFTPTIISQVSSQSLSTSLLLH